ncbi:hypothetical protein FIBSPDRAFT_1051266 [Athelia psychrophila]|uniref:TPPC8 first Ig-like domain-containing protein n=1 Tax=Athelia psychrophila TaxID=1759441 RepID=A0A165ZFP2_9AGAM|nr:hypothetical protein FIBSPDRAFT_1051266 [Fibularhizoctonia sp. CBS 109695]
MPPVLPSSLSPHICVLPSPDLTELLETSSLPDLPTILQSFSPLPNVTTRTTSLASVPHTSFALRFSDLAEIQDACKEDEEQRAVRTIDWIGERVHKRSAKWVEDMERIDDKDVPRTPWWDELRRCAEGDYVPSKVECWNHPCAIILAVSTTAPNPLQAVANIHATAIDLPAWVDPACLRYTLIVHPEDSPLSEEEAGALFNAVKKQYGLHSYLLSLALPSPPPPPVPVPGLIPRLPPPPSNQQTPQKGPSSLTLNTLKMSSDDIQQTARFTREFVVQSLLPWMEKCVNDWNEVYSSNRRLPSRLFSSTRRLFGTSSPSTSSSPLPPVSGGPARSHTYSSSQSSVSGVIVPTQQRRLAEFATILGDFKLAVSVWEALRKDGKGGSEVLPILLSSSPALQLHAQNALSSLHSSSGELPAQAQLRGLIYAVRWEAGISSSTFLNDALEGERWLVWAAGNAEEPPSALLLAHAALLSAQKLSRRRAALWYLFAANRLEKCGIKPLTMYFLRKAHELYQFQPEKTLSPAFWESEGQKANGRSEFDAIMPGIEHPLGRLLYTTGDVGGAVRFFLGLLRGSDEALPVVTSPRANGEFSESLKSLGTDKVFLEDFRVAFAHFKETSPDDPALSDLKAPFTFIVVRHSRIRLPNDSTLGSIEEWQKREETWNAFWKTQDKASLSKSGKAAVDETFWIDLVLRNPLDTEVNLSNLTVTVQEAASTSNSALSQVEVEIIDDVVLGAKETRTIPVAITALRAGPLTITHACYDFLSLLPATEGLASRGRRLHDTPLQRQTPTYAPDVAMEVEVEEASQKLLANFVDDSRLVLAQGECKRMDMWISNIGTRVVGEVWLVAGTDDEIWIDSGQNSAMSSVQLPVKEELLRSDNSIASLKPFCIPLEDGLAPGDNLEFSMIIHADRALDHDLCLLLVYRESPDQNFHSTRLIRHYEVTPLFEVSAVARPSRSADHLFTLNVELDNISHVHSIQLTQITTLSPLWLCIPVVDNVLGYLAPSQSTRLLFSADRWLDGWSVVPTLEFVKRKVDAVLHGRPADPSLPPAIDLICNHTSRTTQILSVNEPYLHNLLQRGRRNAAARLVANTHPHIPSNTHPSIFPLYNPFSVDLVVFWEIPNEQRSGHLLVPGITFGVGHAALKEIIQDAESAKVKRSMYAETQREKEEILDAIRNSEWNAEMDPTNVSLQQGRVLEHNFAEGGRRVETPITLRNLSFTHHSRFVLKFESSGEADSGSSDLLPPPYSGRLTFRGALEPMQSITLLPTVWITRPGTYSLAGWRLETEVGEVNDGGAWRTRQRFVQGPPAGDSSCISVSNIAAG